MTNPVAEFTPWKAFFYDDLKIRAKIQNFSRVHSKLHLKFVLNASPFFYGAIRVAYFPLRSSIPSSPNPLDLVPASQTPGVWLTPQDMSSAELVLPYLNPSNWLCPLQTSDLSLMGTIRFYVYNQLASANGATGSSITIPHLYETYATPLRTYTTPIQHLYDPCTTPIRHLYTTYTTPIRHLYVTYTTPIRQLCDTYTTPIRHLYDTYTTPIRHLYDTYTTPIRHLYNTYTTSIRHLYDTYTSPIRHLYDTYTTPVRHHHKHLHKHHHKHHR